MLVDDEMIDFEAIFGICCNHGSSYKIGFYDNQVAWYCCKRDISCKMVKISNFKTPSKNGRMMIVKSAEAKPIWWMTQLVFLWISPDHQIDFLLVLWSQTNRTEPFSRSQFSTARRNSSSSENIERRLSKFNLQKALQRLGCNFEYPRAQCVSEIEACF